MFLLTYAVATTIVTAITTAVDIVDDFFVSIVDVAIVEPRVQFLAGAPSVCVSSSTVSMVPSSMHIFRYMLSHSPYMALSPFNFLLDIGTQPPLPSSSCVWWTTLPHSVWAVLPQTMNTYQAKSQCPRLHREVPLVSHQLSNSPNTTNPPVQNDTVVATALVTALATTFATAVDIAVATDIATTIDNDIALAVATVMATAIAAVIVTTALDIVVDTVVVAIIGPRVHSHMVHQVDVSCIVPTQSNTS